MNAVREPRGKRQPDRGLGPDEVDLAPGPRKPAKSADRRKREDRVAESSGADGEDAAAGDRC